MARVRAQLLCACSTPTSPRPSSGYLEQPGGPAARARLRGEPLHVMQSNGGVTTRRAPRASSRYRRCSPARSAGPSAAARLARGARPPEPPVRRHGRDLVRREPRRRGPALDVSTEIELEGLPVLMSARRHPHHRSGRRLARLRSRPGPAGRSQERGGRSRARPATAAAARSRRSPTPTSFSAASTRNTSSAARWRSTSGPPKRAIRDVAGRARPAASRSWPRGSWRSSTRKMADAMRTITVQQGIDPRELLARRLRRRRAPCTRCALAEELEIARGGRAPGARHLLGLRHAPDGHPARRRRGPSTVRWTNPSPDELGSVYSDLEDAGAPASCGRRTCRKQRMELRAHGRHALRRTGVLRERRDPRDGRVTGATLDALDDRFHAAYKTRYGHSTPGAPVEFVNVRVAALGQLDRGRWSASARARERTLPEHDARDVVFEGEQDAGQDLPTRRAAGGALSASGPLVVEEDTATTVVAPGWRRAGGRAREPDHHEGGGLNVAEAKGTIDPVDHRDHKELSSSRCAQDMNATLIRSAYTPIIYEGKDCSVAPARRGRRRPRSVLRPSHLPRQPRGCA